MADRLDVFQNKSTISVPRESFLNKIVYNDNLKKKDLKLALLLLTELNGYSRRNKRGEDPCNFKSISISKLSNELDLTKTEIKNSLETLIEEKIIECGDSNSVYDGYRFTF